jgi:uncharacterized integral membrane protein (TIGR00698 family)
MYQDSPNVGNKMKMSEETRTTQERPAPAQSGAGTDGGRGLRVGKVHFAPPAAKTLKVVAFLLVAGALLVWGSPPTALAAGVVFALCLGNPLPKAGHKLAKRFLQACVVMLGFGMNLPTVLRAGLDGSLFAAFTIGATLLLGYWVGRTLNVHRHTSALISAGTAICGGSAIAAVGSVLAVAEGEIAVAMGTVFVLNAVALYLFPLAGHALHLSPHQFGAWAGVAIHDISSVVGASGAYGQDALETATAVKLSRSLWIVPLTLGIAYTLGQRKRRDAGMSVGGAPAAGGQAAAVKVELPWFVALFLLASLARSYVPGVAQWSPQIGIVARGGLTLVLCLIGASLSARTLRAVGWKSAVQGIVLWAFISVASLIVILFTHVGG